MRRMARLLRLALVSLLAAGALLSPRTWAQGPPPEPPAHARTWIVSPVQGAIVQGPDVTFVAASTGIQVPEQGPTTCSSTRRHSTTCWDSHSLLQKGTFTFVSLHESRCGSPPAPTWWSW